MYGESMLIDQRKELERTTGEGHFTETSEDMPTTAPTGRGPRLSRAGRPVRPARERFNDGAASDSDEVQSSGKEWSGNEDEPDESEPEFDGEDEEEDDDDDDQMSEEGLDGDDIGDDDNTQESLVVQLRYRKGQEDPTTSSTHRRPPLQGPNGNSINSAAYTAIAAKSTPVVTPANQLLTDTIDVTRRVSVNGLNRTTEASPLNGVNSLGTANGYVSGNGTGSENKNESQPGITSPPPQQLVSVQQVPLQPMDVS